MEYHAYTPLQPFTHPTTPHNPLQSLTTPYSDRVHGGQHDPRPVGCGHRGGALSADPVFARPFVRLRAAGASLFVQGGAALDPQAARGAAGPTGRRLRRAHLPPRPARGRPGGIPVAMLAQVTASLLAGAEP
eukprot:scaffold90641_cov72-Phaeocystis_antarctica.AAC.1